MDDHDNFTIGFDGEIANEFGLRVPVIADAAFDFFWPHDEETERKPYAVHIDAEQSGEITLLSEPVEFKEDEYVIYISKTLRRRCSDLIDRLIGIRPSGEIKGNQNFLSIVLPFDLILRLGLQLSNFLYEESHKLLVKAFASKRLGTKDADADLEFAYYFAEKGLEVVAAIQPYAQIAAATKIEKNRQLLVLTLAATASHRAKVDSSAIGSDCHRVDQIFDAYVRRGSGVDIDEFVKKVTRRLDFVRELAKSKREFSKPSYVNLEYEFSKFVFDSMVGYFEQQSSKRAQEVTSIRRYLETVELENPERVSLFVGELARESVYTDLLRSEALSVVLTLLLMHNDAIGVSAAIKSGGEIHVLKLDRSIDFSQILARCNGEHQTNWLIVPSNGNFSVISASQWIDGIFDSNRVNQ